jgi:hypothetical protein
MKKLTTAIAALAMLLAISCQKEPAGQFPGTLFNGVSSDSSEVLIQQARSYFQKIQSSQTAQNQAANSTDTIPYSRASLHKTPSWGQAQVQTFSFGKGIVVPIQVAEPLGIQLPGQPGVPISQLTRLFMYRNPASQWQIEVITTIPTSTPTIPAVAPASAYQGKVRVEDWQGNFLKGFLYLTDTIISLTQSSTYIRARDGKSPTIIAENFAALEIECTTTDWYACASIGGVFDGCEYEYSTEECTSGGGSIGSSGGGSATGTPTGPDYAAARGGGGGTAGSAGSLLQIKPDTSITGNPIVACVWNHLMSTQLLTGLKSILSAFGDNNVYNISFTLSPNVPGDGMCSYQGNNNFLVQINEGEADDPNYSRIYLASTFIHEAFHAKLRQRALQTFGEATIDKWPTPIDDMTLAQLATYFESESKSENIWESVEHDWMVENIGEMAASLEDFVQTFYHSTYAQVGAGLAPYEDLMYMGLQNSTLYQEEVVNKGQQASVEKGCGLLNEGGKCQD